MRDMSVVDKHLISEDEMLQEISVDAHVTGLGMGNFAADGSEADQQTGARMLPGAAAFVEAIGFVPELVRDACLRGVASPSGFVPELMQDAAVCKSSNGLHVKHPDSPTGFGAVQLQLAAHGLAPIHSPSSTVEPDNDTGDDKEGNDRTSAKPDDTTARGTGEARACSTINNDDRKRHHRSMEGKDQECKLVHAGWLPTHMTDEGGELAQRWDKYGFFIEGGEMTLDNVQEERSKRVTKTWDKYMEQLTDLGKVNRTRELQQLVKDGVPGGLRGRFWLSVSESEVVRAQFTTDYYESLISSPAFTDKTQASWEIDKDLLRTFPGHRMLQTEGGIAALRRVLVAYSIHNAEVGYCQSLNLLVAMFLLFVNEEEAFWLLETVLSRMLPETYYTTGMQSLLVDQKCLREMVQDRFKELRKLLENLGADPEVVTMQWFMCMYVNCLPLETTLRVWDVFFYEGGATLFRVALALVKTCMDDLLKAKNATDAMQRLTEAAQNAQDCNALFKLAFNDSSCRVSDAELLKLRKKHGVAVVPAAGHANWVSTPRKGSETPKQSEDMFRRTASEGTTPKRRLLWFSRDKVTKPANDHKQTQSSEEASVGGSHKDSKGTPDRNLLGEMEEELRPSDARKAEVVRQNGHGSEEISLALLHISNHGDEGSDLVDAEPSENSPDSTPARVLFKVPSFFANVRDGSLDLYVDDKYITSSPVAANDDTNLSQKGFHSPGMDESQPGSEISSDGRESSAVFDLPGWEYSTRNSDGLTTVREEPTRVTGQATISSEHQAHPVARWRSMFPVGKRGKELIKQGGGIRDQDQPQAPEPEQRRVSLDFGLFRRSRRADGRASLDLNRRTYLEGAETVRYPLIYTRCCEQVQCPPYNGVNIPMTPRGTPEFCQIRTEMRDDLNIIDDYCNYCVKENGLTLHDLG